VNARALASVALCVVLAGARRAHASPEDLFGYGARTPAMGKAGAAVAEGAEAAFANPALLAGVRRAALRLGIVGATFDLAAVGPGLPGRIDAPAAKGVSVGVELPVPLGGALADRIAVGLALFTPEDLIVKGRILAPETPQFPLLPDRAQSVTVRVGAGALVGHGISLGVGVAALAAIRGEVDVATSAGHVGTRVDDQLVASYAPAVGAAYERAAPGGGRFRVGLAFRGVLSARFAVAIDATKLGAIPLPVFNIAGLAQYDPAVVTLEVAHVGRLRRAAKKGEAHGFEVSDVDEAAGLFARTTIALGATYRRWSDYPGPLERTVSCMGGMTCGALDVPHVAYADTWSAHVGAEMPVFARRAAVLFARAGAFVDGNAIPGVLPSSSAYDAATHALTMVPTRYFGDAMVGLTTGVGVALAAPLPLEVDAFGQWQEGVPNGDASGGGRATARVIVTGLSARVGF
jgi:long-chain fatty acid transport protein